MEERYPETQMKYKHLTSEERGKIEAYNSEGFSISKISKLMKRSKSTIFEELRRGKYNGKYQAHIAQNRAIRRRQESHKHTKWRDTRLQHFIFKCLKNKWSPEIISVECRKQTGRKFSHTSIYNLIRKHRPEWLKLLIHRGKRRKLIHSRSVGKISNRVSIAKRPKIVNLRKRFGDFEVDTVLSCRGGKSCLAVFIERQSRMYFLAKMKDKSADQMFIATMKTLKNQKVKTMTYDNGSENAKHEQINKLLNCKSFFCNAYHSWEKGAIENRNKILRQFFPKGTNFDLISDDEILKVQTVINDRPMKALNWLSPSCVFSQLRSAY